MAIWSWPNRTMFSGRRRSGPTCRFRFTPGTAAKVAELFSHRFSGWTVAAAHDDALARADPLIVGRLPGADIPSRRFQPLIGHPLVTTKRDGVMFQPRMVSLRSDRIDAALDRPAAADRTGRRRVDGFRCGKNRLSVHFRVQLDPWADRRRISLNFLKLRTPTLQNIDPKSPTTSRLITNTIVSSVGD
jgi:hypothetical protein